MSLKTDFEELFYGELLEMLLYLGFRELDRRCIWGFTKDRIELLYI
jgi:hypothetical protein